MEKEQADLLRFQPCDGRTGGAFNRCDSTKPPEILLETRLFLAKRFVWQQAKQGLVRQMVEIRKGSVVLLKCSICLLSSMYIYVNLCF